MEKRDWRWGSFRACIQIQYFRCVLDKAGSDRAECRKNFASTIRSLVKVRDLQIEYASLA